MSSQNDCKSYGSFCVYCNWNVIDNEVSKTVPEHRIKRNGSKNNVAPLKVERENFTKEIKWEGISQQDSQWEYLHTRAHSETNQILLVVKFTSNPLDLKVYLQAHPKQTAKDVSFCFIQEGWWIAVIFVLRLIELPAKAQLYGPCRTSWTQGLGTLQTEKFPVTINVLWWLLPDFLHPHSNSQVSKSFSGMLLINIASEIGLGTNLPITGAFSCEHVRLKPGKVD